MTKKPSTFYQNLLQKKLTAKSKGATAYWFVSFPPLMFFPLLYQFIYAGVKMLKDTG
jgi:hypothetical protein